MQMFLWPTIAIIRTQPGRRDVSETGAENVLSGLSAGATAVDSALEVIDHGVPRDRPRETLT